MKKLAKPEPPEHLSTEARELWATVTDEWSLEAHQRAILEAALGAMGRAAQARELLANEGITTVDRFGQTRAHPACAIERDNRALMAKLLGNLGLDLEPLHAKPGRPAKG